MPVIRNLVELRVMLAGDHPMMRDGMRILIGRENDLTVCGEAETAGKALEAVANLKPDLVLAILLCRAAPVSSSLKTSAHSRPRS
jgi:DNA-binding NarL/FixJ family response regulator